MIRASSFPLAGQGLEAIDSKRKIEGNLQSRGYKVRGSCSSGESGASVDDWTRLPKRGHSSVLRREGKDNRENPGQASVMIRRADISPCASLGCQPFSSKPGIWL